MIRKNLQRVGLVLGVASLISCQTVGPDFKAPGAPLTNSYKTALRENAKRMRSDRGWEVFGDPMLNRLLRQVETGNRSLQASAERVKQARARLGKIEAESLPTLDAAGSFSREGESANSRFGSFGQRINNSYDANFQLGYEIDFWGRLARQNESERAVAEAEEAAYATALLSSKAQLARTYFSLRSLDAEIALLEKTVALRSETQRIVEKQESLGVATGLDSARSRILLKNAAADLRQLQGQRAAYENAIATLIGKSASSFQLAAVSAPLKNAPVIPAGIPGELLQRRPDVFETERRLAEASANIGVAEAEFYPNVRLTGSGGLSSIDANDFLRASSKRWGLGPEVNLPVFDGGRRKADLQEARSKHAGALANHQQQILVAFQEVEDALAGIAALRKESSERNKSVKAAEEASRLIQLQEQNGTATSLDRIDAERTELDSKRALIRVDGNLRLKAVELMQALGGGWTRSSSR